MSQPPSTQNGASMQAKPTNPFKKSSSSQKNSRVELAAKIVLASITLVIIIPLILLVGYVVIQGKPSLTWEFLTTNPRLGGIKGGLWSALVGTVYIVVISLCISAPTGVLAAIYLSEYSKQNWFTRVVNLAVVNLAGVPSIVHGLFGLGAFVYAAKMGKSILAASLTLAIMTLPVIIASTREALMSVPRSFREACWNVGASRWQTIRGIVLPNAVSGILTGIILQVSRTAGETAPVMLTGVATFKAMDSTGIFLYNPIKDQCMALSMHLYYIATQASGAPKSLPFAIATVLLAVVIVVNATAIIVRAWLRSRRKW